MDDFNVRNMKIEFNNKHNSKYKKDKLKSLYRFIPVYRLLELFNERNLALMRSSKYKKDDPFEGWIYENLYQACSEKHSLWKKFESLKDQIYFLCLSTDKETDQIWKVYTPHKLGVRIKFKITCLEKCFGNNFVLGSVEYWTIDKIQKEVIDKYVKINSPSEEDLLKLYFYKMKGFKTDNEIRLATIDKSINADIKYVDFDCNSLIENIMFDPRMEKNTFEKIRDYIIKLYAFPGKIVHSTLYNPEQRFKINL